MTALEQLERSLDRAIERERNARSDEDRTYYERQIRAIESQIDSLGVAR